jgi:hypothetical protein
MGCYWVDNYWQEKNYRLVFLLKQKFHFVYSFEALMKGRILSLSEFFQYSRTSI